MSQSQSQSQSQYTLEQLAEQLQSAKESGNTAEYNRLVIIYNKLLEDMAEVTEMDDCLNAVSESSIETIDTQKYIGITNVLNGIVSNTAKGKYSERDKQFFISFMKETILRLEDIDATEAMRKKQQRIKTFSSIDSRL